jgi:multiple sugar transport system permease protein
MGIITAILMIPIVLPGGRMSTRTGELILDTRGKKPSRLNRIGRFLPAYLFVSPYYILFIVFFLVPSAFAVVLSLFRWTAIGTPRWLGIGNFTRLLSNSDFWTASFNTAVYIVFALLIVLPLSLIIASALNAPELRLKNLWRIMFFSPMVTSIVAIAIVFNLMYSRDYGVINYTLQFLGLPRIDWLGDTTAAKFAVIFLMAWRWTGYNSIFFLAGMQSIPQELYEAAMIDGANAVQRFFHITIPQLKPIILYVTVGIFTGTVQIFEEPFILTGGGPANATISVAQFLYQRGIMKLEFGYASAIGLVIFFIVFLISMLQLRTFGFFKDEGQ